MADGLKDFPLGTHIACVKFPISWMASDVLEDEAGVTDCFAQDLPLVKAQVLAATQGPISATLFEQKTTAAAWKEKPSWYTVSKDDRMIAPELERFVAERMKATTVELDTSHASPITRPRQVADLILQASGRLAS